MKLVYLLSVIFLLVSFLMLKKTDKKESIISSIIYSIGLLYCYNIVIVLISSYIKIDGSLFSLSIFNYLIGTILSLITHLKKEKQKYYYKKKELFVVLIVIGIGLLVSIVRFRGFTAISYESGDSSIHYLTAKYFSRELDLLNKTNSIDPMYKYFDKHMPISCITGGIVINLLSFIKSYWVYIGYDIFNFILLSLIFTITLFKMFEKKEINYTYLTIISLLYSLAFPLNNLIFGFAYLGLGVMVFNLLLLTILNIEDLNKNKIYNMIIITILTLSVFYSYYLFMPSIYLALGLYYIYLWIKKKIDFKTMMFYGIITLIIPFINGFLYFILHQFLDADKGNMFTAVNLWGYIYNNKTPYFAFIVITIYMIYCFITKKEKINYFNFNFIINTLFITLFMFLYYFKLSEEYYLFKFFYLYWIFIVIIFAKKMIKYDYVVYIMFGIICFTSICIYMYPTSNLSSQLKTFNIYNWNSYAYGDYRLLFEGEEIELMEETIKYHDECLYNDEFLMFGWNLRNLWFYSITEGIPKAGHITGFATQLQQPNYGFEAWDTEYPNHTCAVYYYEGNYVNPDVLGYKVLYKNKVGAILKRYEKD